MQRLQAMDRLLEIHSTYTCTTVSNQTTESCYNMYGVVLDLTALHSVVTMFCCQGFKI